MTLLMRSTDLSKDFSSPSSAHTGGAQETADASRPVRIALRLHPVEYSDRAVVANVSTARVASSMVFIDFGFIDQQAIDEVTGQARAGKATDAKLDGRLECRIAMSKGDASQLQQQLQRLLATRPVPRQNSQSRGVDEDATEPFSLDNSASLQ